MPRHSAPFKIRLIGPPEHPRFVIRNARRLVDHFWTGKSWSRRLRDARLYNDPEKVHRIVAHLTRKHFRRHEPKRLYLLTMVVRVHAPEEANKSDIERYLDDALVVGVDHERHGTGPTPNSLVEVTVPVISLKGSR